MISLLSLVSLGALVSAKTVTYDFDIGWVRAAPDGFSRPVIGINDKWPIPTIEADMNDDIVVHVRNSLGNQSTSLHFHGMWQQGTNAFDGPVGLSQCAISPGDSYTYRFRAYPAGTHWYHSHQKGQYPDGLRGKMIIHDRAWEKSLNIVQQMHYSMSDWYHREQVFIIHDYLSPDNRNGDFPSPDSFLFNDARNPPDMTFEPKKRYLLRIVSTSAVACGRFHIDGVTLSVVEIDGVQVQPIRASTILVCAGQSYAVVVTGKSNPISGDNYIVKMTTETLSRGPPSDSARTCIGRVRYNFLGRLITVILNLLNVNWTPQEVLDDMTLRPTDNQRLLGPVQNDIRLRSNQTYYDGIGTRTGIGAQPWVEPKLPSLYTALTTGAFARDPNTYGPGADPWVLRSGEVVQIYLENPQSFPHPMHLHGHVFQVVARGSGAWDENESRLPRIPMKRNNIMVPANGFVVLRFKADNPGVWFFHCHVDLHLVGGMASTMIEAPDVLQRRQSIPGEGVALCERRRQCTTGNCACLQGSISGSEAAQQCNTIFNTDNMDWGAMENPPR